MTGLVAMTVGAGLALWTFIAVLVALFAVSAIIWIVVRIARRGRNKK